MREIKFGAFDKKDSGWLCRCLSITDLIFRDILEKYAAEIILGDVILVQFTGLLDKHGKEIYEGDIVRYKGITGAEGLQPGYIFDDVKTIIKWKKGEFIIYCIDRDFKEIDDPFHYEWTLKQLFRKESNCFCEVIGNIYENPELLEENKKVHSDE